MIDHRSIDRSIRRRSIIARALVLIAGVTHVVRRRLHARCRKETGGFHARRDNWRVDCTCRIRRFSLPRASWLPRRVGPLSQIAGLRGMRDTVHTILFRPCASHARLTANPNLLPSPPPVASPSVPARGSSIIVARRERDFNSVSVSATLIPRGLNKYPPFDCATKKITSFPLREIVT